MADNPLNAPGGENELAKASSPYLRQHAHDPVHWRAWTEAALAEARAEPQRPIFLSIGYSACHWCHVMGRESFRDAGIAQRLNESFIPIKVDREERPDLDAIYMSAVQAMTGSGGWPLSVFLTPELEPFFGGTYFPPEDRGGMPSFKRVLDYVAEQWREKRGKVRETAATLTAMLDSAARAAAQKPYRSAPVNFAAAVDQFAQNYDAVYGGLGGAPKFPQPPGLALLLRAHVHKGGKSPLDMALHTLRAMADGGIRDHLGGGFHRYSVDRQWLLPHFEKMLYDNALLAREYIEAFQISGEAGLADTARETIAYVLRDLTNPEGGFCASEDADSEHEEGKFYLWTAEEIEAALGEDAALFNRYYGVRPEGNFASSEPSHRNRNILHAVMPVEECAREAGLGVAETGARLAASRARLLEARAKRIRPGRDGKVIAAWNGLMISALAKAFQVLGDARCLDAAVRAGRFIVDRMCDGPKLKRVWAEGAASQPGCAEDYGAVINALLDLYECDFDLDWIRAARPLAQGLVDGFWDADGGAFFMAEASGTDAIVRTKPFYDEVTPSGNALAAGALWRLGALTDDAGLQDYARKTVQAAGSLLAETPLAAASLLCVADRIQRPGLEIVIAGQREADAARELLDVVRRRFLPHATLAWADPDAADAIPLTAGKTLVDDRPAAYVCRGETCLEPVLSPAALERLLDEASRNASMETPGK